MRRGVFFFVLVFSFLFFSWSKVVWKKGNLVKYRVFTMVEVRSCRASNQFYSLSFVPSFLLLLLLVVVARKRLREFNLSIMAAAQYNPQRYLEFVRILNKNLLYVQSPKRNFQKKFFFFTFSSFL